MEQNIRRILEMDMSSNSTPLIITDEEYCIERVNDGAKKLFNCLCLGETFDAIGKKYKM